MKLPRVLMLHDGTAPEVAEGLHLTGHFLARALPDRPLPEARLRLIDQLARNKSVAD